MDGSLADDAGCQGRLALSKFAKVNQICEECHSLFKELEVYRLCRYDHLWFQLFIRYTVSDWTIG